MKRVKRVNGIALFASTLILLAACGGNAAEAPGPAPTNAAAPKTTVVSPEDRNSQQIGTGDYALQVKAFEDPATAASSYKSKLADSRLVAVEIVLENAKSKDTLDVTASNLKLIGESGQVYESIVGARDGEIKASSLKAGEKSTGWVAFEIPKNAKLTKVRYLIGLLATVQLEAPVPAK